MKKTDSLLIIIYLCYKNRIILLQSKIKIFLFLISALTILSCGIVHAQDTIVKTDTINSKADTIKSTSSKKSDFALTSKVEYKANDSINFNISEQKAYLYGGAEIKYEDIVLNAKYIEISFKNNQLFAKGIADSTGIVVGKPVFSQGEESFKCATLTYNFKTKKGIITDIITKEGDNYLHGNTVKKFPDKTINVKNGQYTTCDLDHPHYEIKFAKAHVIPEDKIVTGPAYLVIEDVPTPLALPFGFFPNKKGQKSGILIPSYGESANRGFYLENGGYYLGLGPNYDLAIRGDIYSRGSWATRVLSNYIKRYKFNGNINLGYAINIDGESGLPGYNQRKDFFIKWVHNQDAKARPNSRFSANVNAGTSMYNTYNSTNTNDYLSNTFQSNISYSTVFNEKYNFSANLRHSQNSLTRNVTLNIPEITFSVNRFYPFRNESRVGKARWYDNISVSYSMNSVNNINTYDTLLFRKDVFNKMQNGMKHYIPISSSNKILNFFNWTNSINYSERWYLQSVEKEWSNDTVLINGNPVAGYVKTDTLRGFKTERDFNFSSSLNTRLYGMYQFKKGKIVAIRHVLTPSVSFVYTPDFSNQKYGYYKYYSDNTSVKPIKYSIFENGIYGSPPSNRSGALNFSLTNNLEMKVRNKKDSVSGTSKVVLIDNFTISGGYDLTKDSLNWSKIIMSGRTKLFKHLDVLYGSAWDPYIVDSLGVNLNQFEWKKNKRLFRHNSTDWSFSLDWSLRSREKKKDIKSSKASPEELAMIEATQDEYVDFNEPWNLNIYYTVRLSNIFNPALDKIERKTIQTLSFNGDINISSKWKVGLRSGYDFEQKQFTYTSVN
ncbi:MAG: LPS-assembly protein LptD, partial [Bacteroidetes bacterium]|nr:LPS-assembly protein LptD [Bacteroidota bacterium]